MAEPQNPSSRQVAAVVVTHNRLNLLEGPNCPEEHWLYISESRRGFHRVGFYSNVYHSFPPASRRERREGVSIYVEKAYRGEERPSQAELERLARDIVQELQEWGWIQEAEVVDPTWIDVAYTWSWPGSTWRIKALKALEEYGIYQLGRYARWVFQGIADSIRDGFIAGSSVAPH